MARAPRLSEGRLRGYEDCRLARAIAVNPSRQEARPFGLRGVTAQRGPSKGAYHRRRGAPSREPDRQLVRGARVRSWCLTSARNSRQLHRFATSTKSPGFLKDLYRLPLSSSAREMRNLPRTSLPGSSIRHISTQEADHPRPVRTTRRLRRCALTGPYLSRVEVAALAPPRSRWTRILPPHRIL